MLVIAHLNHEGARRDQGRQVGVVELAQHSKIILIDDIEIERVGGTLRQIGSLDVPVIEVTAADHHLKTGLTWTDPQRGVSAIGQPIEGWVAIAEALAQVDDTDER